MSTTVYTCNASTQGTNREGSLDLLMSQATSVSKFKVEFEVLSPKLRWRVKKSTSGLHTHALSFV